MFFKDIVGQEPVKEHLRKMVEEGHLPHALLLCGGEGVGAFPLGMALARYLNCANRTDKDACGVCPSCIKYNKLAHPDLHFVFPIVKEKKKNICDDYLKEWTSFLKENTYFNLNMWMDRIKASNKQGTIYTDESNELIRKLSFKTFEAHYKVIIIWLPEKMNVECANKLLKILEEPAPCTHFILVSEEPEDMLGTILSRSQILQVPSIENKDLRKYLQTEYKLDETEAVSIAHIANGNYLNAIQNIQMGESRNEFFNEFVSLMRLCYGMGLKDLRDWSEAMAARGREQQKFFLSYAQYLIRENFMANFRNNSIVHMNSSEKAFSVNFSKFINERNVSDMMCEFALAENDIERNVNKKIVLFDLALKIKVLLKRNK